MTLFACYLNSCAKACSGFCLILIPGNSMRVQMSVSVVNDELETTSAEVGKIQTTVQSW